MPEYNTFGPENQDDINANLTPKKRRGGSALSRYLFQRREHEAIAARGSSLESEEDDESESEEKPKRLRKLFTRIFPRIVEKSEVPGAHKEHGFDPETWFSWTRAADTTSEHPETAPQLSQESTMELADSEEDAEEDDNVSASVSSRARTTATTATPVSSPITSASPNTASQQPVTPNTAPAFPPPPNIPNNPGNPNMPPLGPNNIPNQVNQTFQSERIEESNTRPIVERETVIERRGSSLPYLLIGAEYLARKNADKKLEKRVSEKITQTNTEVNRNALLQQELNSVVKQNREQLDVLKQSKVLQEKPNLPRPEMVSTRDSTEVKSPEQRIEQPRLTAEKPVKMEQTSSKETVQQKIFEQVADAAEHDMPVERVFERSHEVKDDKSVPVGATSVGAVMAKSSSKAYTTPGLATGVSGGVSLDERLPIIADKKDSVEYRQAMQAGFWTATAIIILGSFAYLMLK